DRFKLVNDSLGHEAGDRLLVEVARRLQAAVRPGDTVARFGGDEFVVLCEGVASEGINALGDRLLAPFEAPIVLDDEIEVFASASIGLAMFDGGDVDPSDLLRDADAAMYRAKALGRGRIELVNEQSRDRALKWVQMEHAMRVALDNGELRLLYQPVVDLDSG